MATIGELVRERAVWYPRDFWKRVGDLIGRVLVHVKPRRVFFAPLGSKGPPDCIFLLSRRGTMGVARDGHEIDLIDAWASGRRHEPAVDRRDSLPHAHGADRLCAGRGRRHPCEPLRRQAAWRIGRRARQHSLCACNHFRSQGTESHIVPPCPEPQGCSCVGGRRDRRWTSVWAASKAKDLRGGATSASIPERLRDPEPEELPARFGHDGHRRVQPEGCVTCFACNSRWESRTDQWARCGRPRTLQLERGRSVCVLALWCRDEGLARPKSMILCGCALCPKCREVTATPGTTTAAREAGSAILSVPSRPQLKETDELVVIDDESFGEGSGSETMSSTMSDGAATLSDIKGESAQMQMMISCVYCEVGQGSSWTRPS